MMAGGVLVAPRMSGNVLASCPAGGGATYVIAASNAPAHVKDRSDYVMPSANADFGTVYNDAIALGYKAIVLTEGYFRYSTTPNISLNGAGLSGQGASTVLQPIADVDGIVVSAQDNHVSYLRIFGDKTNRISGNGIRLVAGGGRTTLDHLTLDHIKESAIHKEHNNNETFLDNIHATYNGRGLYMTGSGGIAGTNLWMSLNDIEGMWFDGAQWVNISTFRCDANLGNGITISSKSGSDSNYLYFVNGDLDANLKHGVAFIVPSGVTNAILSVHLDNIQFADSSYGSSNTYDDINYCRNGSGGLYRSAFTHNTFGYSAVNDVRYRINLGSSGYHSIRVESNDLNNGVSGRINMTAPAVPNYPNIVINNNEI